MEVIFTRERFEKVLRRLLRHEGHDYLIRHYTPPKKAIPIIHMMSFDDDHFYLGGFYPGGPTTRHVVLRLKHPETKRFFDSYWSELWQGATPLNTIRSIDWDEVSKVAECLGITPNQLDEIKTRLKGELE